MLGLEEPASRMYHEGQGTLHSGALVRNGGAGSKFCLRTAQHEQGHRNYAEESAKSNGDRRFMALRACFAGKAKR